MRRAFAGSAVSALAWFAGLAAFPASDCRAAPVAGESWEVYVDASAGDRAREQAFATLRQLETGGTWTLVEIPAKALSPQDAKRIAKALEAGVKALPSLALRDERGAFASVPLEGITAEKLADARAAANAANRDALASRRRFEARRYLLCSRLGSRVALDDAHLASVIEECRQLLNHATATEEDRQFLGLRCLYPLLMIQYVRGYQGAHTPATEAKLLEAIAALEAARDINPQSALGREAYAERERLRMARRRSRQYE